MAGRSFLPSKSVRNLLSMNIPDDCLCYTSALQPMESLAGRSLECAFAFSIMLLFLLALHKGLWNWLRVGQHLLLPKLRPTYRAPSGTQSFYMQVDIVLCGHRPSLALCRGETSNQVFVSLFCLGTPLMFSALAECFHNRNNKCLKSVLLC